VPSTPDAAAALLGVPPNCPPEDVERAYRTLVASAHPDRVADLDPRIRASAEEITVALNGARDVLLGRGRPARSRRSG
jgi:curved DNA-binding protein CbpA